MSYGSGRLTGAVRIIVVAIVSIAFVLVATPFADAHTALKASSPQDGSKIDKAPNQILLEFSLPILTIGYRVVVQGPDGHQYQVGTPYIVDNKLTQSLKPLGPTGVYRVDFRVVAADGHPQTFGIQFTLTKPGPAAGGAASVSALIPLPPPGSASAANNAPPWAPWTVSGVALIVIFGAVLFGRRTTHGID